VSSAQVPGDNTAAEHPGGREQQHRLDLERHGGRITAGVYTRIAQRLLDMAATIWHNWASAEPIKRSLIAYDH
jgi:hypothetical protein